MKESFAPEYPRDENGLIRFPWDNTYRKEMFPGVDFTIHPAKANIHLVKAIVEYVSEPGETVADIMAGTGTILIAATMGRRVVCVEIEDEYVKVIEEAANALESVYPGVKDLITIIEGDANKILPLPVIDHVIFSPPYSNILKVSKKKLDRLSSNTVGSGIQTYSRNPNNIGNLNEFLYHQAMEKIYKKTFNSLPPGGTLSIIIKDHVENKKRVFLGERAKKDCIKIGYKELGHYKWKPPGSVYTKVKSARGELVVDDEDIIILQKPKEEE